MALVFSKVVFDGRAPDLSRIAAHVTEISGQPLSVTDLADETDEVSDFHGHLAFACAPESWIEVRAYRAGTVKEFYHQTVGDPGLRLPMARFVQGLNEPAGTQAVYVEGHINQEPTLLFVTLLALEALGGRPRELIPDEIRRIFSSPISTSELEERRRKMRRRVRLRTAVTLVMLPILVPLWILWFLVTLPLGIWKTYQHYREITDGRII
jgi:hypothetical protein